MAETLVKEEICNACQADVRPDSLFCYNCGASVTEEVIEEPIEKPDEDLSGSKIIDEAETDIEDFDEEISEPDVDLEEPEAEIREELKENEITDSAFSENIVFERDSTDIIEESEVEHSKTEATKNANLRSAASLRKRGNIKTKEVKITWEEYENAPNALFIAIALLLTFFAIGIYFVAMYLK